MLGAVTTPTRPLIALAILVFLALPRFDIPVSPDAAPVDNPCLSEEGLPGLSPEIQSLMRKIEERAHRQDKEGRTPLHWAAIEGDKVRTLTLMDSCADPSIKDKYGRTALDYAEAGFGKYHRDVARLIRTRGPMRAKE